MDTLTYNVSRVSEVAAFIPGGTNVNAPCHIWVHLRTGGAKRITDLNSAYDPLHYIFLSPRGGPGCTTDVQLRKEHRPVQGAPVKEDHGTPISKEAHGTVSARAFAAFFLLQRPAGNTGNGSQRAARLYEAYIADQYGKVESQHLQYIEHNQEKLRCHLYSGFEDAAQKGDVDASSIGKQVVLRSFFGRCPPALL